MSADGAPRRRGPRRADAPGTGPAAADGREPRLPEVTGKGGNSPATTPGRGGTGSEPAPAEAERERWLREQRPPHWG